MKITKRSVPAAGKRDGQLKAEAASPATAGNAVADNAVALATTTTTSTTTPAPMTRSEREELAVQEKVIEIGLPQFIGVGSALMYILTKGLWRDYSSFPEYALKRWGLGKSHAYRLIDAAKVVTVDLSPIGDKAEPLPTNENQVRSLLQAPAEIRAEVWKNAVEAAAGGSITGKLVAEEVAKLTGGKIKKPKKRSPWAGLKTVAKLVEEARVIVTKAEQKIPGLQELLDDVKARLGKLVDKI